MTDTAINDTNTQYQLTPQHWRQTIRTLVFSAILILSSLVLAGAYGLGPSLAVLAVTVLAFGVLVFVWSNQGDNITKKIIVHAAVIAFTIMPPVVLLYFLASKWGELFGGWVGVLMGPAAGVAAIFASILVLVVVLLSKGENNEKKASMLYAGIISTTLILLLVTALFVPSERLMSTNNQVVYTTTPAFHLPWEHQQPLERPVLADTIVVASEDWKVKISYAIPDPTTLSSDQWKQYRTLQRGPYVLVEFRDTQNPAEAVHQEFLTYYPFLTAQATVTHTQTWTTSSEE